MSQQRNLEMMVGVFVAAGIVALFFLALQVSNLGTVSSDEGYEIQARFDNIGGIKVKAPVTMAGVRIGRVTKIEFDKKTFEAIATLNIDRQYDRFLTIPSPKSSRLVCWANNTSVWMRAAVTSI